MKDNKKDERNNAANCTPGEDKSISEKVHKHLRDKNDHITNEDIRRAKINPNENELEVKPGISSEERARGTETNAEQKEEIKPETKITTPWDVVDKDATE